MGQKRRPQPKRLAEKLKSIRLTLGLTQQGIVELLQNVPSPPDTSLISKYEQGKREPDLLILLAYAELVGISTDVLIDDRKELPKKFKA